MTTYTIKNRVTGLTLGEYEAESVKGAIEAMRRDAGYTSSEQAAAALGKSIAEIDEDLIVEESF